MILVPLINKFLSILYDTFMKLPISFAEFQLLMWWRLEPIDWQPGNEQPPPRRPPRQCPGSTPCTRCPWRSRPARDPDPALDRARPSHGWPNCCINQAPWQAGPICSHRPRLTMRSRVWAEDWAWVSAMRRHVVCPGRGAYT